MDLLIICEIITIFHYLSSFCLIFNPNNNYLWLHIIARFCQSNTIKIITMNKVISSPICYLFIIWVGFVLILIMNQFLCLWMSDQQQTVFVRNYRLINIVERLMFLAPWSKLSAQYIFEYLTKGDSYRWSLTKFLWKFYMYQTGNEGDCRSMTKVTIHVKDYEKRQSAIFFVTKKGECKHSEKVWENTIFFSQAIFRLHLLCEIGGKWLERHRHQVMLTAHSYLNFSPSISIIHHSWYVF